MKFSDIFKKGYGTPAQSDLLEGGIGVDVQNKKLFSKGTDGNIFQIGLTDAEITAIEDSITDQVEARMPTGMISLWSGSIANVPVGWALCDGTQGTPDLRNRSIIAAGDEFSVGDSGDGSTPEHDHTANHDHTATFAGVNQTGTMSKVQAKSGSLSTSGVFSHTNTDPGNTSGGDASANVTFSMTPTGSVTVNTTTLTTGTTGTGTTVVPKHYALAYIMKL